MTMEIIMSNCLPLDVEDSGIISDKDGIGFGEFCGFTTDELKYIVNAINNHDQLIEMIEQLSYRLNACVNDLQGMVVLENIRLKKGIQCTDETPPDYHDGQEIHDSFKLWDESVKFLELIKQDK